jgi:dihydrofolate reductase
MPIDEIYFFTKTSHLMRKITILSMMTLDGVIQGPGSPTEDTSGGFEYGGWVAPYEDEASGQAMEKLLKPADPLLGRKTFEIWEDYWPHHTEYWPSINEVTKYVMSKTRDSSNWLNVEFVSDISEIQRIKSSPGLDIQVWGSSEIVPLLLRQDLVDELWLMIYPVTLGQGKKIFGNGTIPAAFNLLELTSTPSGVIMAHYQRAGEVRTGTIGA